MSGIFYGIGVGPGDPELLTMKAVKAIKEVDVIIAPKTEKKDGSVAVFKKRCRDHLPGISDGCKV
jgi:precorrin-2/cobalt-factor-2 C20-methyltransferase